MRIWSFTIDVALTETDAPEQMREKSALMFSAAFCCESATLPEMPSSAMKPAWP